MKVLHITNWFPSSRKPYAAQWIRDHVRALETQGVHNDLIHFEVSRSKKWGWQKSKEAFGNTSILIDLPFFSWKLVEVIHFIFLFWTFVIRRKHKSYDLINFHIAYPQLVHWSKIHKWVKKPVAIIEHWSAYHFNFNLPPNAKSLNTIRRIFHHDLPVLTVSEALLTDIRAFGQSDFQGFVIPNVVDANCFRAADVTREKQFFMVSLWAYPKDPIMALEAFAEFVRSFPDYKMRIAGYGALEQEMQNRINAADLKDHVIWMGPIDKTEIAKEMNRSAAFIHCSHYETFSVVCAEAATIGCPVIASNVGGIPEVVPKKGNYLVENQSKYFLEAMIQIAEGAVSAEPTDHYTLESVGETYHLALKSIIAKH